jgi:DNA-binding SARP family transcriptional activator
VHFVLADAVFASGDYHYAAFLIAEAVRLDPAIVTAVTDKRAFYTETKDFDAQMEALQRYITDKPYDAWAQLVLAYNLRFSDRPTAAIAAFRRVQELDPGNPTAKAFLDDLTTVKAGTAEPGRDG